MNFDNVQRAQAQRFDELVSLQIKRGFRMGFLAGMGAAIAVLAAAVFFGMWIGV